MSPNFQLEAAFVTPEGKEIIFLWSITQAHPAQKMFNIWAESHRLWSTHFGHLAPQAVAYAYWKHTYE